MSTRNEQQQNFAESERLAARTMDLGGQVWPLAVAVLLFVVYLFLPHAGAASGWEVVFHQPAAAAADVKITERVFSDLLALGVGVFTVLLLATRRAAFGLIAWMLVAVAFFGSIFAFWMRGAAQVPAGIGMYIGVLSAGVAFVAYSLVALRKSPEQLAAEAARKRAAGQLDEVGELQSQLRSGSEPKTQLRSDARRNPLLVDDRRKRAAARHKRGDTGSSNGPGADA
ncbi:hypothetical protein [Corynebacterium incognita]|nr:hypothetical protein [Corynebacterium incognita]